MLGSLFEKIDFVKYEIPSEGQTVGGQLVSIFSSNAQ
jgi:hypothetical protein